MEPNIGVFYGSSGGNTQMAAQAIARALGKERCTLRDIARCAPQDLAAFDLLVIGTCTLGMGDLQDDWEAFLRKFKGTDLAGKSAAFFGLGDQHTYSDTFVDAMAELHDVFTAAGVVVVGGAWPVDGYEFDHSRAVRHGSFVGLVLDEDNQSELSAGRIERWVKGLGM